MRLTKKREDGFVEDRLNKAISKFVEKFIEDANYPECPTAISIDFQNYKPFKRDVL